MAIAGVDHAPNATIGTIHAFGIGPRILIAWVFIIPIGNPDRNIRADLLTDRPKSTIGRLDEIIHGVGLKGCTIGFQTIHVDRVFVNIPNQHSTGIGLRVLISLIHSHPAVSSSIVTMIDNGW